MVDIVHWNYLCLHIVWHCDIVWHWKYLCLHVVSTHCVYTLENIHLMQCKICAGQKLSVQVQLKISATICDYGTVQSPRKYLSQCWHCSLEIIFDKPYGEHFLVTLSPFRNVIISSSSESSTMDWDADELNKSSSNKHRVMLMMWSHSFHWKISVIVIGKYLLCTVYGALQTICDNGTV